MALWTLVDYFSLFIKQCYQIVFKCRKNTESNSPKVSITKNGRIMLLSKYTVCDSKKSRFMKQKKLVDN